MPFNNIGPMELIIVLVIALLVIGPKSCPKSASRSGAECASSRSRSAATSRDDDDDVDVSPPLQRAK